MDVAAGLGVSAGVGVAVGVAMEVAVGEGSSVALSETDGLGEPDGPTTADGEGAGARLRASSVTMTTKPTIAAAARPKTGRQPIRPLPEPPGPALTASASLMPRTTRASSPAGISAWIDW